MELTSLFGLLVALFVGAVLGAVVAKSRAETEVVRARSRAETEMVRARAERDAAVSHAEAVASDREAMVNQFKVLADQTMQEQGRRAEATAAQRLAHTAELMTPVKDGLAALNNRLTQVERERTEMTTQLRDHVSMVVQTGEHLRRETHALSTALRKPQVRGAWGEVQLRRVVEIAGMVAHCDFFEQVIEQTTAQTRIRPDMKVMLGDGKFVFVDAKVPLSAFLDAQEAPDDSQRDDRLRQFADNVRGHVDALSAKEYWKADTRTPEFVVLFIPSEALAFEALTQRPDLHEYASHRNIVIATPTTLIGMLRAVAYGWKQAALAESAAEVFSLGRELHDRLATMGTHFTKLGRSLQTSVDSYNATLGSLEGRVLVTARRFRDLKVTEKELAAAQGVENPPRQVSAPELLADTALGATAISPPRRVRLTQQDGAEPNRSSSTPTDEWELVAQGRATVAELIEAELSPADAELRELA